MRYKTKETFIEEELPENKEKYVKAFERLFENENQRKNLLGNDYISKEINSFCKEDIICPNKCKTRLYYIDDIHYSNDKKKKIIYARCTKCHLYFKAYQEIIPE